MSDKLEDTTRIDLELIASELGKVAKLARNNSQPSIAADIEALAEKAKADAKAHNPEPA